MAIDFTRLNAIQSPTELRIRCEEAFKNAGEFALSDVLIQRTAAATHILKMMSEEAKLGMYDPETKRRNPARRRKFKIRCLKNMWGEPIKPGDVVEWKADIRRRNSLGVKYTTRDMMKMARENREDEYIEMHAAKVDSDGCIEVEFDDAGKLLNTHGVYYATGGPICDKREMSTRPKKGRDGVERIRHYWLYEEVPPGAAASDPPKRRGRRPNIVS